MINRRGHTNQSLEMDTLLSPYEQQRLSNISQNHKKLIELQIERLVSKVEVKSSIQRKRKRDSQRKQLQPPTRQSRRLAKQDVEGIQLPVLVNEKVIGSASNVNGAIPQWVDEVLHAYDGDKTCESRWRWDPHRTHQHLKVSPSGLRVATFGCAGYGASLCYAKKLTQVIGQHCDKNSGRTGRKRKSAT